MRIDLALMFTWREIAKLKNSVNTNLLIMDEVGDTFDDFGDVVDDIKPHRHHSINTADG